MFGLLGYRARAALAPRIQGLLGAQGGTNGNGVTHDGDKSHVHHAYPNKTSIHSFLLISNSGSQKEIAHLHSNFALELPDCNVYWLYPSPAFPAADYGGSALLHTAHHTIITTDHGCRHPNLLTDSQVVIVCCTIQESYGLVGVVGIGRKYSKPLAPCCISAAFVRQPHTHTYMAGLPN